VPVVCPFPPLFAAQYTRSVRLAQSSSLAHPPFLPPSLPPFLPPTQEQYGHATAMVLWALTKLAIVGCDLQEIV